MPSRSSRCSLPRPAAPHAWALLLALGCGATKIEAPPGAAPPTPTHDPERADAGAPDAGLLLPDAAAGDTASVPACASTSFRAESQPADLVLVIDQSPSMLFRVGDRTKWQLAQEALRRFFADPRSTGLDIGLQFFPVRAGTVSCNDDMACGYPLSCQGGRCSYPFRPFPSCAAGDYERLAVDLGPLASDRAALEAALDRTPNASWGVSPVGPALQGAYRLLRSRAAANPGRRSAVVLVSDGVPSGCLYGWTAVDAIARGISAEQQGAPSIPTFVVGLFSDAPDEDAGGPAALARYASAGGTGNAFIVKPPGDVTAAFLDALAQIRAASLPCEYGIPALGAGTIDFGKVNLRTQVAAVVTDVPYVGSAERCDATHGGWYYDRDPAAGAPTRILACAATCNSVRATAAVEVSITYGCKTRIIE